MDRKVVVTGMGAVSPIGNTVEEFCAGIKAGKSGVAPISVFDTSNFTVKIAAEVKGFDPSLWMDRKDARKMARFTQFAVAAASQALRQAGLVSANDAQAHLACDPERAGVVIGNGIGGFEIVSESFRKLFYDGPDRMLPLTVPLMIGNEAAGNISMVFGTKGPSYTQVTACASGADALGQALDLIRLGRADVVIAGGTESCIVPFAVGGFSMLKTLSTRNDEPEKASRPFDKDRDGFVLGEGAGVLILETLEHAKGRGAKVLAEFAAYGGTSDAYHITSPDPSGEGMARAIRAALKDAGLAPEDIDYYNAHGTSTAINDVTETKSLKLAFGAHAGKLKISSTKSMIGHCIAGGGVLEAIVCILAIRDGFFPPTINLDNPDPECDLDYVPHKTQTGNVNAAMSGNLGFGGHNGVVIFKKY
ncbi:MAG: beta-ketoacyl-ACP synthase II [Spirochaetaceae bacterium]|jgi:3-oxoacyl-[acyl-carrier-protein] synthase II|nr:beta-ketoacyl-ACP synthase II [Spirochaetaceae bacterium]